jgi:DNA (cytosine-5)-methyltransferase 1
MIKILNLYAGIGGNRKLWGGDIEVTAVEIVPEIAAAYQQMFPNDKVIVADAHQYLLEHFNEFDFIWSSPPCPSHSPLRLSHPESVMYPDMKLYEEIILLTRWFKGKWVVENVKPYYEPPIKPNYYIQRHCFWSNFTIINFEIERDDVSRLTKEELQEVKGIDLTNFKLKDKRKLLRNAVNPRIGKVIFDSAFKEVKIQDGTS